MAASFRLPPSIPRLAIPLLVFLLAACDNRSAGVISTGNAGRISGKVVADGQGVSVEVRLIRTDSVKVPPVDSTRSDDSGAFYFPFVPSGDYRVEAWQGGTLAGKSATFHLDGNKSGLLIVLVPLAQIKLDLSGLGKVDSVFLDNPDNPGDKTGNLWTIRALKDSTGVLYTLVEQASGSAKWVAWDLQWLNGSVVIRGASDGSVAPFFHSVDTSAFFLNPHTVALWTFDSLTPDHRVLDQGPYHLDLTLPASSKLAVSPHGRSLDASTLLPNQPAATTSLGSGGTMPGVLRWTNTGMQTIEVRFKLDSLPLYGFVLAGSYQGPRIILTPGRTVQVAMQSQASGESAKWQGISTTSGVVPVGRWVDLALSIDRSREEIYLWLDGVPLEIFSIGTSIENPTYVDNSIPPFSVGGGSWDSRVGAFQVDEVRVSDTLVYGHGLSLEPEFTTSLGGAGATDAGVSLAATGGIHQVDTASVGALVGLDPVTGRTGSFLWKASIPPLLFGKRILFGELIVWDTSSSMVVVSKQFALHEIMQSWSPASLGNSSSTDQVDGVFARTSPTTRGSVLSGSRGGIPFDITDLLQSWVEDTATNHGILLRVEDGTTTGTEISTTKSDTTAANRRPAILVYYR